MRQREINPAAQLGKFYSADKASTVKVNLAPDQNLVDDARTLFFPVSPLRGFTIGRGSCVL